MALAIACGADVVSGAPLDPPELRHCALACALELGGRPSFQKAEDAASCERRRLQHAQHTQTFTGQAFGAAPLMMPQMMPYSNAGPAVAQPTLYRYVPSPRHEALLLTLSRLLRPLWLKPLVWFDAKRHRASFLLEPAELSAQRAPLVELRNALFKKGGATCEEFILNVGGLF